MDKADMILRPLVLGTVRLYRARQAPRVGVKAFVTNLDDNPKTQLRIHTVGFWYWTLNFPIVAYLFFFQPGAWMKWGLFITLIYSIYANWTSDYTGMAASQSVINTEQDISGSNPRLNNVNTGEESL